MRTPRISIVVDNAATVPLRFDDPAFIDALERDGADPDVRGPLAQAMEVRKAAEVDFSGYVEDGWTIYARPSIRTDERSNVINVGQKQGGGVDVKEALRSLWASWVTGVSVAEDLELSPAMIRMIKALGSHARKAREDAFGDLPSSTGDRLMARLRAHIDDVNRPADRDPGKTTGEAAAPSLATGSSFSGDHYRSDEADR